MTTARSAIFPSKTKAGASSGERPCANAGLACTTSGRTVPATTMSHRISQPTPTTFDAAAPSVTKNTTSNTSSRIMKYRSAANNLGVLTVASPPRRRATNAIAAAAEESAEARNRPPKAHVSLHTGWLLTLSSTPVYPAIKRPNAVPTIMNGRPNPPPSRRPIALWGHRASTNEPAANTPKSSRAQAPTDIGDQYLQEQPPGPA